MPNEDDTLKTREARGGIEPPNKGFADPCSTQQNNNKTKVGSVGVCSTEPVLIQLGKGFSALVDAADYERVSAIRWHPWLAYRDLVYARSSKRFQGSKWTMHRFILGIDDPRIKVDHRDGDGLNNTRANLMVATDAENARNRRPQRGKRTAAAKGVYQHTKGKFHAQIMVDGKRVHLGLHDTEELAAAAYNEAARRLHGDFARINEVAHA